MLKETEALIMMPAWPEPLPNETAEHYIEVTLVEHQRAMDEWDAEYGHLFKGVESQTVD